MLALWQKAQNVFHWLNGFKLSSCFFNSLSFHLSSHFFSLLGSFFVLCYSCVYSCQPFSLFLYISSVCVYHCLYRPMASRAPRTQQQQQTHTSTCCCGFVRPLWNYNSTGILIPHACQQDRPGGDEEETPSPSAATRGIFSEPTAVCRGVWVAQSSRPVR